MADHQLTCRGCGNQFTFNRRKAYCTKMCRASAQLKGTDPHVNAACRQEHECKVCGKTFKPKRAGRTTTCGRVCGIAWSSIKAAVRINGGRVYVRTKRNALRPLEPCTHPLVPQTCGFCNRGYYRTEKYQRYCTQSCSHTAKNIAAKQWRQSDKGKAARREDKSKRRAQIRGAAVLESVDPFKVFARDGWLCGICGRKTLKSKRGTYHPRAPELDHIVAIALGGSHTYDNTQCSCRECNGLKGAGTLGQMHLFPSGYGGPSSLQSD